jgi:AcrR family transcriptional regulator
MALPPRHREVLLAGLTLIAERGYAGASLRELARRLGMQQPSLYHYFASKEELVHQIIEHFGVGSGEMMGDSAMLPEDILDLPLALAAYVRLLYAHTSWPLFVRFMFALASDERSFAPKLREMFVDRSRKLSEQAMRKYVDMGQITEADGHFLVRLMLSAIALPLIEEHLLFPQDQGHQDLDRYAQYTVDVVRAGLEARMKRG